MQEVTAALQASVAIGGGLTGAMGGGLTGAMGGGLTGAMGGGLTGAMGGGLTGAMAGVTPQQSQAAASQTRRIYRNYDNRAVHVINLWCNFFCVYFCRSWYTWMDIFLWWLPFQFCCFSVQQCCVHVILGEICNMDVVRPNNF